MHINIGLWIDHRKAFIVSSSVSGYELNEVESGAEKHPSRAEGQNSHEAFESQKVLADDVRDRKFTQHLHAFYDEVITRVHSAGALLVFGPGEAKGEFVKRLEEKEPSNRNLKVETADKMTLHQMEAHVRDYFHTQRPVIAHANG